MGAANLGLDVGSAPGGLTADRLIVPGRSSSVTNGDSDVGIASGSFSDSIEGRGRCTWGRLEAGLGGRILASGWVDLGDVRGWGVRAGFRF